MFNHFLEADNFTQLFIIVSVLVLGIISSIAFKRTIYWHIILILLVTHGIFLWLLLWLSPQYLLWVHLVYYIVPSLLLGLIIWLFLRKEKPDIFDLSIPTNRGEITVNLRRSLGVFGSSGAGKTESVFSYIIKHMAQNNLCGLNYDYKHFELSELVYYYFGRYSKIPVYTFSPSDVDRSHRINPIDVSYLNNPEDVLSICEVLIANLGANFAADGKIFSDSASGALAGTIWVLKTDYPEHCNLPTASSILLLGSTDEIIDFISHSTQAKILASEFLDSRGSDRQMAAVKASLSNFLKRLATPALYYLLSGNDLSLKLNDNKNPAMLNIVNHPKYADIYSPVLATILQVAILQMSERDKLPSVLLTDEGSTIKIPNWQRVFATLRSYNVSTVWGLQDKVQGELIYKTTEVKAILANISTKFVGKANDPDTAEYYERFFPFIKESVTSYSHGSGFLSRMDGRINVSEKEQREVRANKFYELSPGEFFIIDDRGKIALRQIKRPSYERVSPEIIESVSAFDLEENFNLIHENAKSLLTP